MQLGLKVSSVLKITVKSLYVGQWDFPNWSKGAEKIQSEVFEKDISWTIWTQQGQIL